MRVLPKDLYHIFLNAAMASAISCIVLSSIGGPSSFRSSITVSAGFFSVSGCSCWLVKVPISETGTSPQSAPFPAVPEDAPLPGYFPGRLQYLHQTSSHILQNGFRNQGRLFLRPVQDLYDFQMLWIFLVKSYRKYIWIFLSHDHHFPAKELRYRMPYPFAFAKISSINRYLISRLELSRKRRSKIAPPPINMV